MHGNIPVERHAHFSIVTTFVSHDSAAYSSPTAGTFLLLIVTFSSPSPLSLSPFLSLRSHKSLPCALLHTRLVRSNYRRAVQPPGSHTHRTHTHRPLSLSLYQLGINLLKQRGCWRAAHRRPCEVLPLQRSTLLPILRTTHSATSFPLSRSQNKSGSWASATTQARGEKVNKHWMCRCILNVVGVRVCILMTPQRTGCCNCGFIFSVSQFVWFLSIFLSITKIWH